MSSVHQAWRRFRFRVSKIDNPCLYFPKHGIVYINNPKSGCSTIKRALTGDYETDVSDFHFKCDLNHVVYNHRNVPATTPWIFIGREPVARFLSCYMNKVIKGVNLERMNEHAQTANQDPVRDHKLELVKRIRIELNLPDSSFISIDEFIEYVRHQFEQYGTSQVDAHYRPQTDIINQSGVRPDFIGRLEDMPTLWERLQSNYNFEAPILSSWNTTQNRVSLSSSQARSIQDLYKIDLKTLNY